MCWASAETDEINLNIKFVRKCVINLRISITKCERYLWLIKQRVKRKFQWNLWIFEKKLFLEFSYISFWWCQHFFSFPPEWNVMNKHRLLLIFHVSLTCYCELWGFKLLVIFYDHHSKVEKKNLFHEVIVDIFSSVSIK